MSTSPARPNHGSGSGAEPAPAAGATPPKPHDPRAQRPEDAAAEQSATAAADFPFVALTVQTTGIHPSTARLVALDAVTFNAAGKVGQDFHAVLNPGSDPGPRHLHGLSHEEVSAGQSFSRILKPLDRLLDGRTLIVHDTPFAWGFVVSEARRAMTAAARQNRSRNRNRGNNRRRRQKVGHVPAPERIIDTLASARRQGAQLEDIRLATTARHCGVLTPSAVATTERANVPESQTSRKATELLVALYLAQAERGPLATTTPDEVRGDKFGLQRSHLRVDAEEAPRIHQNPGPYRPGHELEPGMEIVVAPEITADPDEIIAAITRHELNYSEKLSRETSLVVCNVTTDLVGKPMHAHRKGIPLMSDRAFLEAVERITPASEQPDADNAAAQEAEGNTTTGASRSARSSRGGRAEDNVSRRSRRSRRRRRRSSRGGANRSGANNSSAQSAAAPEHPAGAKTDSPSPGNGEGAGQRGSRGSRRKRGGRRRGGHGGQRNSKPQANS
ncbi:DNA polymerase III subunit epsilon [uncultured Corynebacterium sp.]|uniref:DNA polymerase III subunit epsilon n=1 Tax=uncultured Corynebacterium sp. TaxID=159447 RepID=UPI0025E8468B|nr:DNA polymerase III subunit epsilon [uncultured Corynebacterium sp.]